MAISEYFPVIGEWIKNIFLMLFALSFLGGGIFVLIIVYAPSDIKFHVTDASLTKFNLTNNNTLDYKLEANITSRNPNKNVIVYYREIAAIAFYKDHKFATVNLTPFDQGHKTTSFLHVLFEGKGVMKKSLQPKQLFEYDQETRLGIYHDLAINLDILATYKFLTHKSTRYNPPMVQCRRLSLSVVSNGNSSSTPSFHGRKCRIHHFFENR
ncbi:NDR1/HIN1-like protein 10 [Trifolium pratense]|uniref:NDR1/HIN1-like protein 10 n=1 Tax=Trifolium pratense TaxID=57577 RepID=UPI001E693F70|nr:NDR1/HIN1-like protein 10 [Trifolium pratense]